MNKKERAIRIKKIKIRVCNITTRAHRRNRVIRQPTLREIDELDFNMDLWSKEIHELLDELKEEGQ